MDFLWHEVSEKEKKDISKQAKNIMDSFSKKLSKIDSKKLKEAVIERDESEREESSKSVQEINKDIMFENAPNKNNDFIIAEKKGW